MCVCIVLFFFGSLKITYNVGRKKKCTGNCKRLSALSTNWQTAIAGHSPGKTVHLFLVNYCFFFSLDLSFFVYRCWVLRRCTLTDNNREVAERSKKKKIKKCLCVCVCAELNDLYFLFFF